MFTSQHPFTKDTADKPLQGEKGSVQSTFSPAASSSYLPHIHRGTHTHTYISLSLSLSVPLFLCLINVCVLYPLLFAPRQLRHCSDGGGGRVYMCACVRVCQRQRGRGSAGQKWREELAGIEREGGNGQD